MNNFVIVIAIVVVIAVLILSRTKPETFIDSVEVLDMFKYITPQDFVKALGSKEKIAETFVKYNIPQEYIKDPKYYPQIASYIYTQAQKVNDPLLKNIGIA